jgi:hypothetical protein
VEDLEVLEQRGAELDACLPFLAVEEFRLKSGPEGFDRGVVKGIADGAHRGHESCLVDAFAESPGGELASVIAVDHSAC